MCLETLSKAMSGQDLPWGVLPKSAFGFILGLYRVYVGVLLGLHWDNGDTGKENGNCYN